MEFPGSKSDSHHGSTKIIYSSKNGAPKVSPEQSSPPPETILSNILSTSRRYSMNNNSASSINNANNKVMRSGSFGGGSRSRSGSLKQFRKRLQSFSSSGNTNNMAGHQAGFGAGTYSPRNSVDLNSLTLSTDDLTSEIGPDFVRMNLKTYNEILINYLIEQGLNINPLAMKAEKLPKSKSMHGHVPTNISSFLTGNGQILFIPYNPAKKREQLAESTYDDDDEGDDPDSDSENEAGVSSGANTSSRLPPTSSHHKNPPHNATNHTFAVILKLAKTQSLTTIIKAKYYADATTSWTSGILVDNSKGRSKLSFREKYKVSKDIEWDLNLKNPDCFIPFRDTDNGNGEGTDDQLDFDFQQDLDSAITSTTSSSNKTKYSADLYCANAPTQSIKRFEVLSPKEYINEIDDNGKDTSKNENLLQGDTSESRNFQPGYYIFLLPIVYPLNTPESIRTPLGSINHRFLLQIEKSQYIPTLQPPQSAVLSTSPLHSKYDDIDILAHHNQSNGNNNNHNSGITKNFLKKIGRRASNTSHNSSVVSNIFSSMAPNKITSNPVYEFSSQLPAVRLPPSDATSTLNKSIYVNKVWNDSLNYELLLPKKFIHLSPKSGISDDFMKSNPFILQMKLIPLVKNLSLKRIKVNVVEKITYVSKDRKYETDIGSTDRSGIKERCVTLLEIKTKEKSTTTALNTQIIKGCINDNLLTCCYNNGKGAPDMSKSRSRSGSTNKLMPSAKRLGKHHDTNVGNHEPTEDVAITNPVKLQCPLTFAACDETGYISEIHEALCKGATDISDLNDFEGNSAVGLRDDLSIFSVTSHNTFDNGSLSGNHNTTTITDESGGASGWLSKSPLSPILSPRKSSITAAAAKEDERLNEFAFYPDITFHNMNIRHRLQICFRISKPDDVLKNSDGEPKMHHYEVIVDTPIVFVSPFCVQDNIQLPSYDYAVRVPGFEFPPSAVGTDGGNSFVFKKDYDENKEIDEDLPTFEEAILMPSSPMMTGFSIPTNLSNNVNSVTMLSQSPFSMTSASPPPGVPGFGTGSFNTHALNDSICFNNLDSLIQEDMSSLSLVGMRDSSSNSLLHQQRRMTLDDMFAKKDIAPKSANGQLSDLLKVSGEQTSNTTNNDAAMAFPVPPHSQPTIVINGSNSSGEELAHVPSRSSLEYYQSDLPSYQAVLEEDSANIGETMGLLSDEEGVGDNDGDVTFSFTNENDSMPTLSGQGVTRPTRFL